MRYMKMKRLDHRFIIQKLGGRLVNREKIIVIDFGGQYNQLVARRVEFFASGFPVGVIFC